MIKEKTPSALRSVTSRLRSFSEHNWIGLKAQTIAASAPYTASLKGLFILQSINVFLLETSDLCIVQA